MFVDYMTLLLLNMTAGLVLLAVVVLMAFDPADCKPWAAPFAVVGFIAVACGLHMSLTWPPPGSYNIAFGETSVLLGACFLGAALALGRGWPLTAVAVYALFAGAAGILVGAAILKLDLTASPELSGAGFILTGVGAMLVAPALALRKSAVLRVFLAVLLLAAAAIWAFTGYFSYWKHMESFGKWTPATMREAGGEQP